MSGAYYNEHDPYAAAWLRNLIKANAIAPGDVDERSIVDVQAQDLKGYTQWHLFAGIAGWSRALRLADWPDGRPVLTASVPCQPFSAAGNRRGHDDDRNLWPHAFRLIRELHPPTTFGEQVAAAIGFGWLDRVFADMEREDYACAAFDLPAACVQSPHIRQRLYWMAESQRHPRGTRWTAIESRKGDAATSARTYAEPGRRGVSGAVADTMRERGQQVRGRAPRHEEADGRTGRNGSQQDGDHQSPGDGQNSGLGDTDGRRLEGIGIEEPGRITGPRGGQPDGYGDDGGFDHWQNAIWLPCLDGKARRTKPGIHPLAVRLPKDLGSDRPGENPYREGQAPWRIGMLRAYGNSIVPQLAAAFIRASMEDT